MSASTSACLVSLGAGIATCSEIGGDFYDYFSVGEDILGLLVADVSGHGVQAGMVTTAAKASLHTLISLGVTTPSGLLAGMNNAILATARQTLLMTCLIASIDLSAGTLTDELVIRARELAPQSERADAIRQLLEVADDITDELEEAAFHLTLLSPEGLDEELRRPLAALAQQLVDSTQEYLKAIENARGNHRSGSPDDMHDFLESIHRIVAIEEQSDTTERLVRKALVTTGMDYRQAFVVAECARKLESAADALMHTGMTLRDQILGKVVES